MLLSSSILFESGKLLSQNNMCVVRLMFVFQTPSGVSPGLPSYLDGVPLTLVQPKEESTDYQCWPPPTLNQPSKENGQPLNYENTLNQPSHLFQLKEELAPVECGEADRVVDIEVELDFGSPIRSSDTLGMSEEVSTEVEREVTLEEDREGSTELVSSHPLSPSLLLSLGS